MMSSGKLGLHGETFPCELCGQTALMLIYLERAGFRDHITDIESMAHAFIVEQNVPTLVLGPASEIMINGHLEELTATIQIWPTRGRVHALLTSKFNVLIAEYTSKHCEDC